MNISIRLSMVALTALLFLAAVESRSQEMVVTFKNGDTEKYGLSEIRSIQFGESEMVLHANDGGTTAWAIADIEKYTFDKSTSATQEQREGVSLFLYPNPTSAELRIRLALPEGGEVGIDILSAEGRPVAEVYRGPHQGNAEYQWEGNTRGSLSPGVYHCRIRTERQTLTRPFIIR